MGGSGSVLKYVMTCDQQILRSVSDGNYPVCTRLPAPEVHRPTPAMCVTFVHVRQYFEMISLGKNRKNKKELSHPVHLCRKSGIIGFSGSYDPRAERS